MKKLLLGLGVMALCLAGCDSDNEDTTECDVNVDANCEQSHSNNQTDESGSNDYKAICNAMFVRDYHFDRAPVITADKLEQLKTTHNTACESFYGEVPRCKSELHTYFKCIYVDNTEEYWAGEKDKEEACYDQYGSETPEADACVDKLFQACKTPDAELYACMGDDDEFFGDDYTQSHEAPAVAVDKLLAQWGLSIDDLYDGGE